MILRMWDTRVRICVFVCVYLVWEGGKEGGQMTSTLLGSVTGRVEVVSTPCYFDRHAVAGPDSTQPSSPYDIIILALLGGLKPTLISNGSHYETSGNPREFLPREFYREKFSTARKRSTLAIYLCVKYRWKLTLINALSQLAIGAESYLGDFKARGCRQRDMYDHLVANLRSLALGDFAKVHESNVKMWLFLLVWCGDFVTLLPISDRVTIFFFFCFVSRLDYNYLGERFRDLADFFSSDGHKVKWISLLWRNIDCWIIAFWYVKRYLKPPIKKTSFKVINSLVYTKLIVVLI